MFAKSITDRSLKKVKPRKATNLFGERLLFSGKKLRVCRMNTYHSET